MSESFAKLFEETFASQNIKPGTIIKAEIKKYQPRLPTISSISVLLGELVFVAVLLYFVATAQV